MEAAVTWMVVWGIIGAATPGMVGAILGTATGALLADSSAPTWTAVAAFITGWAIALAWFIFCVVQFINNLTTVISLN